MDAHASDLRARLDTLDWPALLGRLDTEGFALSGPLLSPAECADLIALYGDDGRFRKRIVMERYRYGLGDYAYFAHPLPEPVTRLREALYARLAPVATEWTRRVRKARANPIEYPPALRTFLATCHAAGQRRPTPLLLHYEVGGYNCLHQDLYGAVAFPLQATFFLSKPGVDYEGGEFLLVEQRPRQQSRGTALTPEQGAFLLFPSAERPVLRAPRAGARREPSKNGYTRARMRHGVSTVTAGRRYTLGIIFHDAE